MQIKKQHNIDIFETLEEYEPRIVLECLNYSWHRMQKHGDFVLNKMVRKQQVDKLRRELIAVFNPPVKLEKPVCKARTPGEFLCELGVGHIGPHWSHVDD
mgnify:CR=1 FL=1